MIIFYKIKHISHTFTIGLKQITESMYDMKGLLKKEFLGIYFSGIYWRSTHKRVNRPFFFFFFKCILPSSPQPAI